MKKLPSVADKLLDRADLLSVEILERERFMDTILDKLWMYDKVGYAPATPINLGITYRMKVERDELIRRAKMIEGQL